MGLQSSARGLLTASPVQTQPPVERLTGLRYQGVLKFLPARAEPACCSRTSQLNRFTRVSASAEKIGRLITSSRLPSPGQPEGFGRIRHKTAPRKGLLLNRSRLRTPFFPPNPSRVWVPRKDIMVDKPLGPFREQLEQDSATIPRTGGHVI